MTDIVSSMAATTPPQLVRFVVDKAIKRGSLSSSYQ